MGTQVYFESPLHTTLKPIWLRSQLCLSGSSPLPASSRSFAQAFYCTIITVTSRAINSRNSNFPIYGCCLASSNNRSIPSVLLFKATWEKKTFLTYCSVMLLLELCINGTLKVLVTVYHASLSTFADTMKRHTDLYTMTQCLSQNPCVEKIL